MGFYSPIVGGGADDELTAAEELFVTDLLANGMSALTGAVDTVFYANSSGDVTELPLGADGTFLKSNGATSAPTFATPAGSGDVSKVGTPVNNQVGVWTGDGTIEGDAALTFDTSTDTLSTGGLLDTSLTASEIVITDGSKNLASAAVATYPSLTELAYIKGLTSSAQTQITARQLIVAEGAFVDGDKTKLDGIEASADVTDTTNVTSAGALMDGEVTNLAQVKAFDTTDYATAAQGATADSASQATGVEDNADVTDTANVTAAGALMDSELASITDVKALDQSVVSGATPTFTTTNFTDATNKRLMTDAQETVLDNTSNTNTGDEAAASTTVAGVVELDTDAEFTDGTDETRYTNAKQVASVAQTMTNKRVQPRTASSTTAATLTPALDTANIYYRTTQTAALTIGAPTGTPVIGETIVVYVDSVGAETLTMNATYKAFGAAFPATTTAGKTMMISAQYNGTDWKTLIAEAQ